jgi:hypothetical protein
MKTSFEISVGRSKAFVNWRDIDIVKSHHWSVNSVKHLRYAHTIIDGKFVKMHRLILGLLDKPDTHVDHINGDGLDNRRENLRMCRQGENSRNLHRAWGASRNRGVFQMKGRNKWRARITYNYTQIEIGAFDTEADAVRAYAFASRVLFGEFGNPVWRNGLSISESAGESLA